METKISDKELGLEFVKELDKVLKIRKERRLIYHDSFLHETPAELLSIIDGKRKRLGAILSFEEKTPEQTAKLFDETRDICNYYLFLLCVLQKQEDLKK